MKLAIAGKGGSGKTTVAGTLARALARKGRDVLALDADTNPMLGISVGMGPEETDALLAVRQGVDSGEVEHQPTVKGMIETFGRDAPDGVRLVLASRIEQNDPGCPCCGVSAEQMIREFEDGDNIVIADLEAGVGTLSRLPQDGVDTLLLIVEPTAKSIEVGRVVSQLLAERHPGTHLVLVANRVKDDDDLAAIRSGLGEPFVVVPDDPSVTEADKAGRAPIDADAGSPAVLAVSRLADLLELGSPAPVPA